MDVELIMMKSDGSRRTFHVKPGVTVIGRTNEADLRVPLPSVSRRHCEVTVEGDVVRMRDLGSSNGTLHNSVRVEQATLAAGDQLALGPVTFLVRIDGQPAEVAASAEVQTPGGQDAVTEVAGLPATPSGQPAAEEVPVAPVLVEDEDPLAAMAAAAAALDAASAKAPVSAPVPAKQLKPPKPETRKPQVIQDAEMPRKIEPELESPTVDLDDPISALERLAAEQAALDELAYSSDQGRGKKKSGK